LGVRAAVQQMRQCDPLMCSSIISFLSSKIGRKSSSPHGLLQETQIGSDSTTKYKFKINLLVKSETNVTQIIFIRVNKLTPINLN
jgi:hypothetical protein